MRYFDIVEKLGLVYKARPEEKFAVMSAVAKFFVCNPGLLENPLSVAEHLHEAQKNTKGKLKDKYEFTIPKDSSLWEPKFSDVIFLTEEEGQEFLDYYEQAREYAEAGKTNTRAYHALEDAFEDLKSTYLDRVMHRTR